MEMLFALLVLLHHTSLLSSPLLSRIHHVRLCPGSVLRTATHEDEESAAAQMNESVWCFMVYGYFDD